MFTFVNMFQFVFIVSFLLGWLDFWAEVHPVWRKIICPFYRSTHFTTRQTGGEGWWVVNSPCLSAITTHYLTLAGLPHFFSLILSIISFIFVVYVLCSRNGGIVGLQFPYFWSKRFMMSVDNGCLYL